MWPFSLRLLSHKSPSENGPNPSIISTQFKTDLPFSNPLLLSTQFKYAELIGLLSCNESKKGKTLYSEPARRWMSLTRLPCPRHTMTAMSEILVVHWISRTTRVLCDLIFITAYMFMIFTSMTIFININAKLNFRFRCNYTTQHIPIIVVNPLQKW